MVVLRYLKSYIHPVPDIQVVGTAQRDISRKSSGDGGERGGGEVGGWHYIFPIYDFFKPHSTTWTPRTGSVTKWPGHDATLEGGGLFEGLINFLPLKGGGGLLEGGSFFERGGLLIFFHSWPILMTKIPVDKTWSPMESSRKMKLESTWVTGSLVIRWNRSVKNTLHDGIARLPRLLFTFESFLSLPF